MNLFPLFPTQVVGHDISEFSQYRNKIVRYCYEQQKNNEGVQISNNGGWQSHELDIDILEPIYEEVSAVLSQYLTTRFFFGLPWININPPQTSNDRHTHPGSDLSAVLWIKSPENCGEIEFSSPSYYESFNLINSVKPEFKLSPSVAITPVEGRVVIFPSHVLHRVLVNRSDEDRISIAWNIKVE